MKLNPEFDSKIEKEFEFEFNIKFGNVRTLKSNLKFDIH